jgi:hypothetical protein
MMEAAAIHILYFIAGAITGTALFQLELWLAKRSVDRKYKQD